MVMVYVLKGLNWKHGLCYIDDILIFSSSFQEHLQHLESVFDKLRQVGLTLKADKCHFAVDRVLYLGHVIMKNGIFVDEKKTEKVSKYQPPNLKPRFAAFLDSVTITGGLFRVDSKLATPLNQLLQKDIKFSWSQDCEISFQGLKHASPCPSKNVLL